MLHGAPFYTTLLACTKAAVPVDLFIEAMYYLERVARVSITTLAAWRSARPCGKRPRTPTSCY